MNEAFILELAEKLITEVVNRPVHVTKVVRSEDNHGPYAIVTLQNGEGWRVESMPTAQVQVIGPNGEKAIVNL